ncbi:MAG: hypothetical protein P8P74_01330 [Crocinitomicaceae bacterium]|nr:hypothetical protein [Crocinitomicaceae bacterium]
MEENILDHSDEITGIEYSPRNGTLSIVKGIIGFVLTLSLTAFYLWCSANMFAFSSGRAESIVNGLIIYAILVLGYSILSILIGTRMRENNQKSSRNLEIAITIVQIAIAVLLVMDWWFTFEMNIL